MKRLSLLTMLVLFLPIYPQLCLEAENSNTKVLSNVPRSVINLAERNHIAAIIYAESAGESLDAKNLVATTMYIRARGNPKKIYKMCAIDKQYASPKYGQGQEWEDCLKIADNLYNNTFVAKKVVLGNGKKIRPDHFFSGDAPWWAEGQVWKKVGNLKFPELGSYRTGEDA